MVIIALDSIKMVMEDKIKVNEKTISNRDILYYTAYNGYSYCKKALTAKVNTKFQFSKKISAGWTALHITVRYGHLGCLQKLLNEDAIQINEKTPNGWTALHIAARFGYSDCLQALLNCDDIRVNEKIPTGWTPLHIALSYDNTDCTKILLQHKNIQLNEKTNIGRSVLCIASMNGYTDCIRLLLAHEDILVNVKDNHGRTPLYITSFKKNKDCTKLLLERSDLLILGKKIACLSELNKAARNDDWDYIKHLLLILNFQLDESVQQKLISLDQKDMHAWEYVCEWITITNSSTV